MLRTEHRGTEWRKIEIDTGRLQRTTYILASNQLLAQFVAAARGDLDVCDANYLSAKSRA